jgi:hypothetical protein
MRWIAREGTDGPPRDSGQSAGAAKVTADVAFPQGPGGSKTVRADAEHRDAQAEGRPAADLSDGPKLRLNLGVAHASPPSLAGAGGRRSIAAAAPGRAPLPGLAEAYP